MTLYRLPASAPTFGKGPSLAARRTLAKFGLGIDRRPTHNSPMNKLYYERADYSVVVKKQGTSSKGMEVGDLPGRKCQPHQASIGLFRHYRGGQAGGQRGPQGPVE